MKRRHILLTFAGTPLLVSGWAHASGLVSSARKWLGPKPRRMYIGIQDCSGSSASDADAVHREALQAFFQRALPGDVLIGTSVGDAGVGEVQLKKIALPHSGRTLRDKRDAKEGITAMTAYLANLPRQKKQSRFLETLAALQADVMHGLANGWSIEVLVAGDGVENSRLAHFERPFNQEQLLHVIGRRNLFVTTHAKPPASIRLMFAGVGGADAAAYARVKKFWTAYAAQQAGMELGYYGRGVPPFADAGS